MAATCDGVKLAIAEAGAVKPLIRLIRSSAKPERVGYDALQEGRDAVDSKGTSDHLNSDSWGSGRAVQVDPINPTLKAPRNERLTLKYDELLSTFAFKFNLRRYTVV